MYRIGVGDLRSKGLGMNFFLGGNMRIAEGDQTFIWRTRGPKGPLFHHPEYRGFVSKERTRPASAFEYIYIYI